MICDIDIPIATFLRNLSVNLTYVFITRYGKIPCFNQRAVYVLTLHLSHLFFVCDSQKLTYELRVDSYDLDYLVPKLEQLATYLVKIMHELIRDLVRIL